MKDLEEYTKKELEQLGKEEWYESQIKDLERISKIAKMTVDEFYGRPI